jgi:hypothetical protein
MEIMEADLHQGRMEDDEGRGGTPMLPATGTLDRKTSQAPPTTCFHKNQDEPTKRRNQSQETNKKRNQCGLPTYTNNKPTDRLIDERPTISRPCGYHGDDEEDDDSNDYGDATDGSKQWKQPMEALLDGTTLTDDRTANDTGKWNGGQMPIGWINVCEAMYCKALKVVTTARREGSQR